MAGVPKSSASLIVVPEVEVLFHIWRPTYAPMRALVYQQGIPSEIWMDACNEMLTIMAARL